MQYAIRPSPPQSGDRGQRTGSTPYPRSNTECATRGRLVLILLLLGLISVGLGRTAAAVTLRWFEATPQEDYILVEWETASELDTLGFNVLRSTNINGPFNAASRINPILIQAQSLMDGAFFVPHQYAYRDLTALPGVTYFYVPEEIDAWGNSHPHLDFEDSATYGTPLPTATASPTATPTAILSMTPTRTPVPRATPTATATPPPPTSTPLVLGGPTVTPPPLEPTDTRPAPTAVPVTAQPIATSQPATASPTRAKPTRLPAHPTAATPVQAPATGPAQSIPASTSSPAAILSAPTGTRPLKRTVQSLEVGVTTPLPLATASAMIRAEVQSPGQAVTEELAGRPSATEGPWDLSWIWRLSGALAVGILALALSRFLRTAG